MTEAQLTLKSLIIHKSAINECRLMMYSHAPQMFLFPRWAAVSPLTMKLQGILSPNMGTKLVMTKSQKTHKADK